MLDLHGNQIENIPDGLSKLQNLQILNLSGNMLKEIPEDLCSLPLIELQLQGNNIERLPKEFGRLSNLAALDLSRNALRHLPDSISRITSLQSLNISHNKIQVLSNIDISSFGLLKSLIASNNQIFAFDDSDDPIKLPKLTFLDLKYNEFKIWDTKLICQDLKDFCCAFNKISTVQEGSFSDCPELEVFDIRDNNIGYVPKDVLVLYNLKRLDITNNSISTLPPELSLLKKLVAIHHTGNPLRGLPSSGKITCEILLTRKKAAL